MGPVQNISVDGLSGPRWELALELLQTSEGTVNMRGLVLHTDPATPKTGPRLHIEFACPVDPSQVGKSPHERLESIALRDLQEARHIIESASDEDERFGALVANYGVVYEFVHRYGMGALLVATAGRLGDLTGK